MDGVKLVSSEILGIACETIMVNSKVYVLFPPTIEKIAGAGMYLSEIEEAPTAADVIKSLQSLPNACKALSWFIAGNESLAEELSKGTLDEVIIALTTAISLIGIKNFPMLSALVKNVRSLIAVTR